MTGLRRLCIESDGLVGPALPVLAAVGGLTGLQHLVIRGNADDAVGQLFTVGDVELLQLLGLVQLTHLSLCLRTWSGAACRQFLAGMPWLHVI
jgi:hypothetical protein